MMTPTTANTKLHHSDPVQQLLQFTYTPTNHKLAVLMDNICRRYGAPQLFTATAKSRSKNDTNVDYSKNFIVWRVNEFRMRILDIPDYYKRIFAEFFSSDSGRFIAFPLLMMHPRSIFNPQTTEHCFLNINHVNMVVYDKHFGYLERFDSGNNVHLYDGESLDTVLVNSFQQAFGITVRGYLTPWMICGNRGHQGIQALQEAEIYAAGVPAILGVTIGFCSVYSLWYLEQRLRNAKNFTHPSAIVYNHISRVLSSANTPKNNNTNNTNNTTINFPLTREIIKYTKRQQWIYNSITCKNTVTR